ncbi:hypothetical protein N9X02_09160 [Planktomarina temperata]|nr:hypothetical protein [Planktomarina temperata]
MFKKVSEHLCLEKETMTIQQHASFDSSAAELNATSKLVKAWESKNAKNAAKAGGISMMALSLAACGGSSTTTTTATDTTTTDTTTTVVATPFTLTPLTDIASESQAASGALASSFRFTSGNDVVNGMTATMAAADTLIDGSTTDVDVLNITGTGSTAITTVNIETVNLNAASGTVVLDASAISGVTNVNVSGAVASEVDNASSAASINLDGYTRVLTINNTEYAGTTAAGNADVLNVAVSGATHGSTAATKSGITLITDNASTLETLNIASNGSAANDFTLNAADATTTLSVVNVTGTAAATVRVINADLTGLTFNGTAAGDVTLVVDREGATTSSTNANLWSGIDNLMMVDSATPAVGGDGASVSGLTVGQKITLADDFNATTLAFSAATGTTDTATIILDNETASTDTDVASINIQNIETLTIQSSGNSASTSTTAENLIDDLVGDATTITVTGDTSIDLDLNIDAATSGARSVTVDASANTAFVNIEAAAGSGATATKTVSYSITGTAGNDTLALNAIGGTLVGGAGNDILTGSALNDTITTGAGTDAVFATSGTDTVTFGAGVDTITFGESDVTAVVQSVDVTPAAGQDGPLVVTIDGSSFTQAFDTDVATTFDNFITTHSASIIANTNVTAITDGTTKLTFTGDSTSTDVVISATTDDGGVIEASTIANTASVAGVVVATSISGFTTGAGGDVVTIDVSEMNAVTGIDFLISKAANITATEATVIEAFTTGSAVTVGAGVNVIKVGFSNTINSAADMLAGMDATVTTKDNTSGADAIITMFYDADGGALKLGLLTDSTAEAVFDETGSAFAEIASLTMTSTEYTALDASNITFIT